jgi:hypothetical protein
MDEKDIAVLVKLRDAIQGMIDFASLPEEEQTEDNGAKALAEFYVAIANMQLKM